MIETPNSDVEVDRLMAELRREVEAGAPTSEPRPEPVSSLAPPTDLRWLEFLSAAERHAAVGLEVPAFNRYGPVKRFLARLVARPILYMAELVTHPQRTFNTMALEALRALGDRVQTLERELAARRGRADAPGSRAGKGGPDA